MALSFSWSIVSARQTALGLRQASRSGWTASSNVTFVYSSTPADVLDGNLQTVWMTSPTNEDGDWLAIDMQAPQTFNCVVTTSPKDNVGPYVKPYIVYVSSLLWKLFTSEDGQSWQGPIDTIWSGPHDYKLFTLETPVTARHIKIVRTFSGEVDSKDRARFGFNYPGVAELYVANANDLPVESRFSSRPPLMTEDGIMYQAPYRMLTPAIRRTQWSELLNNMTNIRIYSVNGRAMNFRGQSDRRHAAGSVLIVDPRALPASHCR